MNARIRLVKLPPELLIYSLFNFIRNLNRKRVRRRDIMEKERTANASFLIKPLDLHNRYQQKSPMQEVK